MVTLWRCGTIRSGLCTLAVIFPPRVAGDGAEFVEMHFAVDDLAEEGLARVGDQGDEVTTLGGVVVAFEADGAAVGGGEEFSGIHCIGIRKVI